MGRKCWVCKKYWEFYEISHILRICTIFCIFFRIFPPRFICEFAIRIWKITFLHSNPSHIYKCSCNVSNIFKSLKPSKPFSPHQQRVILWWLLANNVFFSILTPKRSCYCHWECTTHIFSPLLFVASQNKERQPFSLSFKQNNNVQISYLFARVCRLPTNQKPRLRLCLCSGRCLRR